MNIKLDYNILLDLLTLLSKPITNKEHAEAKKNYDKKMSYFDNAEQVTII